VRLGGPGVAALLAAAACRGTAGDPILLGTVERTLVELVAPVSETIREIPVTRGEPVTPGQVLVRLDPTLAEADVAAAEATLAGARTARLTADHDLERLRDLHRSRIVSAQDLEKAELNHDEAAARLREAEARLDAAVKRLGDQTLVSPVHGVVDQIPFDPGERVPAGGVVAVVLDDATPWVRVWVPEERVARVRVGAAARIRIDGLSEPLHGTVLDVAREAEFTPHFALTERDRAYLVYETRVGITDAPRALRPGIPAEVTLVADEGAPR
jgi:HlyD family secretion protein